eukprot:4244911-Amphidinium_carterae.1
MLSSIAQSRGRYKNSVQSWKSNYISGYPCALLIWSSLDTSQTTCFVLVIGSSFSGVTISNVWFIELAWRLPRLSCSGGCVNFAHCLLLNGVEVAAN